MKLETWIEEVDIIMLLVELLVAIDDGVRIFDVKVGKLAELVEETTEVEEIDTILDVANDEEVVEILGLSTIISTQLQNLSDLVSIVH